MFKLGFAALLGLALVAGCHNMNKDCCSGGGKMALKDADMCSHCEGMQHATKDGKCDKCGMALKDSCAKCAGTQITMPDGTCSGCGMVCSDKKS